MTAPNECACDHCKGCCESRPGWFAPGEAEKAAEHLGLSLPEFFAKHLGVDWIEACEETEGEVFILAPALEGEPAGEEYPGRPTGRCSLLTAEGTCMIHPAKPRECAHAHHDHTRQQARDLHMETGLMWKEHQQQIRDLLGRQPETTVMMPIFGGPFGAYLASLQ